MNICVRISILKKPIIKSMRIYTRELNHSPDFVEFSKATIPQQDFQLYQNVLTKSQQDSLVKEVEESIRRRRYEGGHWDKVIVNYREIEKQSWSEDNLKILQRVVKSGAFPPGLTFLPIHVLDLAEDGYIKPHVDNIKVSWNFPFL